MPKPVTRQEDLTNLKSRLEAGEVRAIARAISLVEAGDPQGSELLAQLRPRTGQARLIGITGTPGSGKSTLTDALVGEARARGERVAVIAVDPSSPFTGGAILGDRIRMTRWHSDEGVFIRSMASRGHLGGMAAATLQVAALLDAAGFPLIIIETVGVGQSEVEIAHVADTTVLVLTPGQGDTVQTFKAGVMEIADLFVVNKADQPGAQRLKRELRAMLDISLDHGDPWRTPILETIANQGEGVGQLMDVLQEHHAHLESTGLLPELKRRRARYEVASILREELQRTLARSQEELIDDILAGRLTPETAARSLLER